MISVSTIIKDSAGDVIINELPESKLHDSSARVSRSATLDGGCVITDSGFCDADRTFDVRARPNKDDVETLRAIFKVHSLVHIATAEGFFSGKIERLGSDNGGIRMTVIIKEKLA